MHRHLMNNSISIKLSEEIFHRFQVSLKIFTFLNRLHNLGVTLDCIRVNTSTFQVFVYIPQAAVCLQNVLTNTTLSEGFVVLGSVKFLYTVHKRNILMR